jgi:hypothetical protein
MFLSHCFDFVQVISKYTRNLLQWYNSFYMTSPFALETKIQFLLEKHNEPYKWYGEVSIAEENWIWGQEASGLQAPLVSRLAGA